MKTYVVCYTNKKLDRAYVAVNAVSERDAIAKVRDMHPDALTISVV